MNKRILLIAILSSATLLFSLGGCEGPAGPQGSQGDTGPKGTSASSIIGFDTLTCGKCHIAEKDTSYHVAARTFQWENSVHASGGHSYENGSSCAECHTSEGFIQKMSGQSVSAPQPSPPGCFACHSPHLNLDFSLRNITPVSLLSNITGVANATFDYGQGNLCVQCHHPRSQSVKLNIAKLATTDTIKITSSRWYGHYGVQSQLLMGEGGFEWPGYTYNNSFHASSSTIKQEGCIVCHMSAPFGDLAGGHSMRITYMEEGEEAEHTTGCTISGCHSSTGFTLNYNGKMTEVEHNMDTLKILLAQKGWIDTVANSVKASTSAPLVIVPANKAGAIWNYFLVEHDKSEGVHNTNYALGILRASIEELRKP